MDSLEKQDVFTSCKNFSKSSISTTEEHFCLSEEFLSKFCREVSMSFFNEFGLISHQINSYNEFIKNGLQKLFYSIPDITVEPGFDQSMKGEGEWRYASVSFGKVTLERPTFWTGQKPEADDKKEYLNLLPRHARLQNMTYSSRMKVEVNVQVYTQKRIKSDIFKPGKEQFLQKEIQSEDKRDIVIGRIPVMVKSNLCWMNDPDKSDCDFDHGGYFLIKGAEKLCFLSTPDGENCGLVKNMAITGLVSTNLMEPVMDKLLECGMEKLVDEASAASWKRKNKVFLNGYWVGVCEDSLSFVVDLRNKRRNKEIPQQVEIKRDQLQGEVRVFSDAGRILRPLLIVENLKKIKMVEGGYTFQSLLDEEVVELIGVEEEEDCQTAWDIKYLFLEDKGQSPVKYTHCELDLSFLLGLSCGIIPFANHDHARRVLYQSEKHSQQAIGFSTTNPNIRVDTLSHQLYYPQRPLFRTMISDCLGRPAYPLGHNVVLPKPEYLNGQNAIVAVNVHQGYNQEDSLVMNRASLERGMFRSEHIRSYKAEVNNKELWETKRFKSNDKVDFGKSPSKIGRVNSLDDDGFPFIGANLESGDIIIGRCAESGADDGKNFAVVSLRQVRAPSLGDKFSSMHGQKGVVGLLESQENFPFTRDGVVPDIVINPHAFLTRQTPGQLLEATLGKGISCGGSMRYATPFTTPPIDAITDQLHRAGYSRWGSERVCNGQNGEMMRSLIFMGPTFYQRLIHMAEDKVKFRNTGPVHPLTRQPVADRKRFGGVKFGEMERDCLLAHGATANLHERLFTLSDFSQMNVCHKCNNMANMIQRSVPGGGKIRGPYCRFCESAENVVKVNVPYGAKLLCLELFSMGISVKFETEQC